MSTTPTRPPVIRQHYRPPSYLVHNVELDICLHASETVVSARYSLTHNPAGDAGPLILDRDGTLPEALLLDGRQLPPEEFIIEASRLIIPRVPQRPFTLDVLTVIDPKANTSLNGLYLSNGIFCTQCEAEGFRRITPFIDRPDVLARYRTRLEAKREDARFLLANGNLIASGALENQRHFAVWDDPWPKPCYLFAAVAGNLARIQDHFTTRSGRKVALDIYAEEGKQERCAFAMESLKRAMAWDEEAFGREYDLDTFMLVAVSDFNMGAMENKGLNIFNDKYVLADPERATDRDFIAIESIIAHEYFHNWTGNRITCRDWFQLCVKEGLTVYRDQEFTADVRSRAVKRIQDVKRLRATQFVEDAGPLAHAVRPDSYQEINNFYTATIYEKGAELIRMLKILIGAPAFAAGMDLYFTRHDGEAVTVEDFIACFAETSGQDLNAFMVWYQQPGTPDVRVDVQHDRLSQSAILTFHQILSPMAGPDPQPLVIPIKMGLLDRQGHDIPLIHATGALKDDVFVLNQAQQSLTLLNVAEPPIVSLLRGFSAPVRLSLSLSDDELIFLLAHDSDSYNRWQAGQSLALRMLMQSSQANGHILGGRTEAYAQAIGAILSDQSLDDAYVAEVLILPSQSDVAREIGSNIDPDAIRAAHGHLKTALGTLLRDPLLRRYKACITSGPFTLDAGSTAKRALKNALLDVLCASGEDAMLDLAFAQFTDAKNMTESFGSLSILSHHDGRQRDLALQDFYDRHSYDPLVIDKWFAVQATKAGAATLSQVHALMSHSAYQPGNPNRISALIGTFAFSNPTEFNRADGSGFRFIGEQVQALDAINPQVAARLMTAFRSWRSLEPPRRAMAKKEVERLAASTSLSVDVQDILKRTLGTV